MAKRKSTTSDWGWEDRTGPVWGAQAYDPKGGQDHLGLGSVSSDRILPALSPGINVLTIHPRYWSFYAWVLATFWNQNHIPRTRASFRSFYRPREALFSMACHVCEAPEHNTLVGNIVGSRRVQGLRNDQTFDPEYDYIKEPLGGYGLYYRSAMEAMGVLVIAGTDNDFPFDAPTPVGRALAAAYGRTVEKTPLGEMMAADKIPERVSRQNVIAFANAACLCRLRVAENFDLPLVRDLFLHVGHGNEPAARRETLRFVLDLSQSSQAVGIEPDEFRQLAFYRELGGATYEPREDLAVVARRWRLYQAREYFSFAFNRLFGWVTRTGLDESEDGLSPAPIGRLWEIVDRALDESRFVSECDLGDNVVDTTTTAASFADLLAKHVDLSPGVNAIWPRNAGVDEHALYERCTSQVDDAETLVAMLAVLLLLYRRLGTPGRVADLESDWNILRSGESLRIGMLGFFTQLHKKVLAGVTLSGLARWVIKYHVIIQHERVATSKLPYDTFRVRRSGEQLRFFVQEAPAAFNDSRFLALSTTVHELGLVSPLRDADRRLTAPGRELLVQGDLEAGDMEAAAAAFEPPREDPK
ncbi:hypothetical protein GCM10009527_047710 [Actinomadura nitritigenes]|uniref:Uncharacterized protein n=1 Tax=Actinomadura nitritigenes TaxID=134602 RepID=A0ABS3QTV9_9ACTN|nr:hypothetical protein [Actinomadura nitritigenes]MBO2437301.1 hypothetical protein [Actinomadura nitritigenes]